MGVLLSERFRPEIGMHIRADNPGVGWPLVAADVLPGKLDFVGG
jgi:hypothetical protein